MAHGLTLIMLAASLLGVFRPALAQEISPDALVGAVLHDSQGRYWFGTQRHGVFLFDGEELASLTTQDGLADDQVRSVREDARGVVWLETASGLNQYENGALTVVDRREFSSVYSWSLSEDDLWFKGERSTGVTQEEGVPGVYRFDGQTRWYHAFPLQIDRADADLYSVTGICRGEGGRVWIATYAAVIGFDGEAFVVIDDASLGHETEAESLHVRCVFEDSAGRLWIGNNGIGVLMHDGDTTINFTQAQGAPEPGQPGIDRVFSIGEDRHGNIWFGTRDQGAWRFDGETLRQFDERDGLETKGVFSIHTDRNGDLWVGGHGVYRFNGASFERRF